VTQRTAPLKCTALMRWPIIRSVRRESSTVVVVVGEVREPLLTALAESSNVALVRPPAPDEEPDRVAAATRALAEAGHRAAPFVLVTADPLAAVAAQWRAMWDLSAGTPGPAGFEAAAAEALAVWRAGRFELPDYYLSLTPSAAAGTGPDLYLGPLRAARPRRVAAVLTAADDGQAAGQVRQALRELPHGPWWPPLDELLDAARRFNAGGLAATRPAPAPDR
jgi:hypothetical protein